MKKTRFFLLSLLTVSIIFLSQNTVASAEFMQGEVLVKFKEGTAQEAANAANTIGATLVKKMEKSNVSRLKLPPNVSVTQAVEEFKNNPNVEFAQPNYIYRPFATPNDTNYSSLWGLNNTGQTIENPTGTYTTGTSDADIDAPLAWDRETGSTNTVVIAVIDTGIKWHHVDLYANRWENTGETDCSVNSSGVITCTDSPPADTDANGYVNDRIGWDFVNNDNNPTDDCDGHGTHVAGTIAAVGNNTAGVTGVMWTADLMPLKALGINSDCEGTSADISEAIYYAVNNGAHIINMSLGGSSSDINMYNALAYARDNNVLVVAAAGNDGTNNDNTPVYPASYDLANIISVAATDQNDNLASFSNYGAASVDLAAPGVNIYSTVPDVADCTVSSDLCDNSDYNYSNGTSMAAPHVTGVAGLYIANNGLTTGYATTKAAILDNVNQLTCLSNVVFTGGRLNAAQTLGATITPSKVTNLSATATSTSVISLNWTDVTGETGYKVYRKLCSASCSSYLLIGSASAGATSYSDTGLSENTCYEYVIRAFNATDISDHSNEASATTPSLPPSGDQGDTSGGSGHSRNCFIATSAYGNPTHPYVKTLREFRDKHLLTNYYGRAFVDFYYKFSPAIAEVIRDNKFLKAVTRIILTPVVMFVVYPHASVIILFVILLSSIILFRRVRNQKRTNNSANV